eukprot:7509869-Pyramimonas_sp.AAC.1
MKILRKSSAKFSASILSTPVRTRSSTRFPAVTRLPLSVRGDLSGGLARRGPPQGCWRPVRSSTGSNISVDIVAALP